MNNILVSIYAHPEGYPPTLNAIDILAEKYDTVIVVGRKILPTKWGYAANVTICLPGNYISVREFEKKNTLYKIFYFFKYLLTLKKQLKKQLPSVILAYDPLAFFAVILLSKFSLKQKKYKIWYHNHDILEFKQLKKYSIQWFAGIFEKRYFHYADYFSLPSNERLKYFPKISNEKYFFIPNYPSLKFYKQFYLKKVLNNEINIIFQGNIDFGHYIENFIPFICRPFNGYNINILLKGWISENFMNYINEQGIKYNCKNNIRVLDITSYQEVPKLTSTAHIGIAIHHSETVLHKTLATASNKIYEYAALGLPVILYDNNYYKSHLGKRKWAFFTDGSQESIKRCIADIINNYAEISAQAHYDYLHELHFEYYFNKAIAEISTHK